ncbi:rhodanese-like domain-containing protein [Falsarthrobacter nasiphocae]|uniref:Rhodanese-related sulfurtransferase n=1 Tax=Falsarthrobacter nasiphocae TaxID=189863 RepID=A0AAE3YHB3_9MICC|nr:rhodanese-like domain-containing protein [Falsarthrobacter nasiphocae]MDR6892001.1 rhodanese-related sulfurtransferase [Falsarthrobacter nasiphocae]
MHDIENISATDLTSGDDVLDVREQDEWDAGHIEGARHIPLSELPLRIDELDPDVDYKVICLRGGRSAKATQWLVGQGYSAVNVSGGMDAWADADKPIVSAAGEPFVKGH